VPEKETFSVRLTHDMSDAIEQYADENDVSQAEALRRAVRDQYLQPSTDGGEVIDRVDELDAAVDERVDRLEQQQARQNWGDTLQNGVNLAGVAFIVAYFTGGVGGPLALLAAVVIILAEAATLAYNYGVFDDE
jgi:hypothetical protein